MNGDTFQTLRNDPLVKSTFAELDKTLFQMLAATCASSLATEYNFGSYTKSLQGLKVRLSRLPPEVEAWYMQRVENRLTAYTSLVSAAQQVSQMLTIGGLHQILSTRANEFFSALQTDPYDRHIQQRFREMGATDDDIDHYQAWLRANDWNPLMLPGAGGTFEGLVTVARNQTPFLQAERDAIKEKGIPVLQGASGNPSGWVGPGLFASLVVICLVGWIDCTVAIVAQ
jgi:hypothetical protein